MYWQFFLILIIFAFQAMAQDIDLDHFSQEIKSEVRKFKTTKDKTNHIYQKSLDIPIRYNGTKSEDEINEIIMTKVVLEELFHNFSEKDCDSRFNDFVLKHYKFVPDQFNLEGFKLASELIDIICTRNGPSTENEGQ